jgi:hypothetical protein
MAWHARWGHLFLKAVTPADFFPTDFHIFFPVKALMLQSLQSEPRYRKAKTALGLEARRIESPLSADL